MQRGRKHRQCATRADGDYQYIGHRAELTLSGRNTRHFDPAGQSRFAPEPVIKRLQLIDPAISCQRNSGFHSSSVTK
jgi:hypothetical protein